MSVTEFWDSYLWEVETSIRAYHRRQKDAYALAAWATAITISPHIKNRISPSELLGEERALTSRDFESAEDMRAYYNKIKRSKDLDERKRKIEKNKSRFARFRERTQRK